MSGSKFFINGYEPKFTSAKKFFEDGGNIDEQDDEKLQVKYHAAARVCSSLDTVVPLAMADEQKKFNDRLRAACAEMGMSVEQYVAKKLHYRSVDELCYQDFVNYKTGKLEPLFDSAGNREVRFSAEQIDALATSIWVYETEGNAIIVADQAGSGKGRYCAGLIRYGIKELKKIPFFFTEKKHLINDIYRDLAAIGLDAGVPQYIKPEKKEDKERDVINEAEDLTDEQIWRIIVRDIKDDDDVRVEYDFPYDEDDDDFDLSVLTKKVKEGHKYYDRVEEIKTELIDLYRQHFTEEGYEKESKPEANPDYQRQVSVALRNGRMMVEPFVPNRIDVKDIKGNILYEAMTKREADAVYRITGKRSSDPNLDLNTLILPSKYKVFAIPYSQLSFGYEKVPGGRELKNKIKLFQKYANGSIVILDESHNASGSKVAKKRDKDEKLGAAAGLMFAIVKNAEMVSYVSATYAKRANNMPLYALRTSIRESGLSDSEMIHVFAAGGNALQEAVSVELVKNGQLLRREKVIQGATTYYYENEGTEVGDNQIAKLNKVAQALDIVFGFSESVRDAVREYAKANEDDSVRNARSVKALSFQIFNFMLIGMKINQTSKYAIEKLQSGRKTVVAVANTMESVFDNISKTFTTSNDSDKYKIGEKVKNDFSLYIAYLLFYTMRYNKVIGKVDEEGNEYDDVKTINILDSDDDVSEEVKSRLLGEYNSTLQQILSFQIGIPLAPLDMIEHNIKKAGFKVDEITGRKRVLVFENDDYSFGKIASREIRKTEEIVRDFNENETDCVLINQSGASGLSMHALPNHKVNVVYPEIKNDAGEFIGSPTSLENKKEVKKRAMIVTQMELDINKEVQKLGRINRNGQVYEPEYTYIVSAIPSEARLTALTQMKLKSLMSNVSGHGQQASYMFTADDFFSEAAFEPFNETVFQVNGTGLQIIPASAEGKPSKIANFIREATKKLYFKQYSIQKEFYDTFAKKLQAEIHKQIAQGTYTGKMLFKRYAAETIVRHPFFIGDNNAKTTFGGHSFIEYCSVRVFKDRNTERQIEQQIIDALKLKTSHEGESGEDKLFNKLSDFRSAAAQTLKDYDTSKRELVAKQIKEYEQKREELVRIVEGSNAELGKFKDLEKALQLEADLKQYNQMIADAKEWISTFINEGKMDMVQEKTNELNEIIPKKKAAEEALKPMEEILKQKGEHRALIRSIKYGHEEIEKFDERIKKAEESAVAFTKMVDEGISFISKIGAIYDLTEYEVMVRDEREDEEIENDVREDESVKEASRFAKYSKAVVLTGVSFPYGYSYLTPGKFELHFSDATERYTYNLYNINKVDEHVGLPVHSLRITHENYKGIWGGIVGKIDNSVKEDRFMITGSMLKTFSLGRSNDIAGQIVKYSTKDDKLRLGIEVADKEDNKSGRKSVYQVLKERYGDTTNLQYPVYYDGNTDNVGKFISDYIYWFVFGETYDKIDKKIKPEDGAEQDTSLEYDGFYFQVATRLSFQMIVVTVPRHYIEAAETTNEEYNETGKTKQTRVQKEEFVESLTTRFICDSIRDADYWAYHFNRATGNEINSENYTVAPQKRGQNPSMFENANLYRYGKEIDRQYFRRGSQFKYLFPTNLIELEDMLSRSTPYTAELKMSFGDFLMLIEYFTKRRTKPTFATASGYFHTRAGEYILDQNIDNFEDVKTIDDSKVGDNETFVTVDHEAEIDEMINELVNVLNS